MGHEETARGANGRFRPIPAARTGRVRAGCPHELVAGSEERGGRPGGGGGGGGSAPGPLLSSWVDASTRGSPELRPRGTWQVGRTCDRGVRVQGTTRSSPTFSGYVSRPREHLALLSVFAQRAGPVGLLQTVRSCLWGGGATKAGLGPLIRGAAVPGPRGRNAAQTGRPTVGP